MGGQISKISSAIVDCGKEFGTALTTPPGPEGFYQKASMMTPRQGIPGMTYYAGTHPLTNVSNSAHINTSISGVAAPQPRVNK